MVHAFQVVVDASRVGAHSQRAGRPDLARGVLPARGGRGRVVVQVDPSPRPNLWLGEPARRLGPVEASSRSARWRRSTSRSSARRARRSRRRPRDRNQANAANAETSDAATTHEVVCHGAELDTADARPSIHQLQIGHQRQRRMTTKRSPRPILDSPSSSSASTLRSSHADDGSRCSGKGRCAGRTRVATLEVPRPDGHLL